MNRARITSPRLFGTITNFHRFPLSYFRLGLGLLLGIVASGISPDAWANEILENDNIAQGIAQPQQVSAVQFRGVPIPQAQLQSMSLELSELIHHYEMTLASAGVFADDYPKSSVALVEALGADDVSSQSDQDFNLAAHGGLTQVLSRAKAEQQKFLEGFAQGDYHNASRAWVKAKNILRDNFPTGFNEGAPSIRAIWLDRGTIVEAQSEADLVPLFDRLKKAGINLVFFETVNAGYPIYPSEIAPQQNPLTQDWDPLAAAVKLAHARDMELHAWAWVFSAANQKHNEILDLPREYPGPVLEKNPTWAITDRQGDRPEWISGKSFIDPANPEVRDYLHSLFEEIVTRYDVDGLQLDYIRYPFQNASRGNLHGYSVEARRQFQQQYRLDPSLISPGHRAWNHWLQFKAEKVDSFVQETAQRLKTLRPNLVLSAAVFPLPPKIRHHNLQQNWQRWVKEGWVDLLVPMTYAPNLEGFRTKTDPLFEEDFQGASLMLPGLRLLNMPSYKTAQQVQYIQQSPTPGYSLFAAAHFRSALTSALNRPAQKKVESILPHRDPIRAALSEYTGLKREWHHWLSSVSTRDEAAIDLQSWAEQSDAFEQTLTALLPQRSDVEWPQTLAQLAQLHQQTQAWMDADTNFPAYQQQRWSNRFQRIQTLLVYGKKLSEQQRRLQEVAHDVPVGSD